MSTERPCVNETCDGKVLYISKGDDHFQAICYKCGQGKYIKAEGKASASPKKEKAKARPVVNKSKGE